MDIVSVKMLSRNNLLIFTVVVLLVYSEAKSFGAEDYCMLDVFEPQCSDNEVIIIDKATFGRMSLGKCITESVGPMKCYTDVQTFMDSLCSGRRTCSVSAAHRALLATNPCNTNAFSSYLTVAYSCQAVLNQENQCSASREIHLTSLSGYLATMSNPCPVTIKAPSNQLINFTIMNFINKSQSAACYEVAVIKENQNQKSIHICPSDPRIKVVHISSKREVSIHFTSVASLENIGSFLLHFEATGCTAPTAPSNAYIIREGDTATIICNKSETSWTSTCTNNIWQDMEKECPSEWNLVSLLDKNSKFPYGIFITSTIGVGLGVLIGGFLLFLAINAFQRYQRRNIDCYEPPPVIPDPDYKIYDTAKLDFVVSTFGTGRCTLPKHQMAPPKLVLPMPQHSEETMRRFSKHDYEKPNYNSHDGNFFQT